jgi:hypothetical protein
MWAVMASEFGRENVVARISRGGVYSVNPPLTPLYIFIEHVNELPHMTISTLNQL